VLRPEAGALPIVVDSPHSGTDYPPDFGAALPLERLRQSEDTFVHELWGAAPQHGATLIAARFPRCYIDPNRGLEDIDEALLEDAWPGPVAASRKTELGIGLVWRLCAGEPIYARRLAAVEVRQRIERCWRPYRETLDAALHEAAARHAQRWHLNVHSMPDDSYRRLGLPEKPLADFVLGNLDDTTCDESTIGLVEAALAGHGFSVARNDPFKGVEIVRASGRPQQGWHALQIEVKRSLYMDADFQPHAGYARVQAAATAVLAALAAHARKRLAAR
jgi:N-formylglutamate deformylase